MQRLDGVTSGLYVNIGKVDANNGIPVKTNISIRGFSTINGTLDPLIVLDNSIYEGDYNNINPNDVESVTVLKDAAATSIYGARGGNGVIVITTKKGTFNQKLRIGFSSIISITNKADLYSVSSMKSSDFVDVEQFLFSNRFENANLLH